MLLSIGWLEGSIGLGEQGWGGKGLSAIGVGSSEHLSLPAALIRPWTGLP